MNRQLLEDSESRFVRYVEGLTSTIGYAGRAAPLRDYCVGLVAAEGRKSVEPMAAVTAPAGVFGATSEAAAFRCGISVFGRAHVGQGARDGGAGDRAARTDQGVDYRRYLMSEAGQPLGRCASSVLRTARQAGQLSGGGDAVDR